MGEIYLDNDHRIDIVVTDSTGRPADGLTITGSISENPTGSAAVGVFTLGPSSSFSSGSSSFFVSQTFSESYAGAVTTSFTESIQIDTTSSFTSSFSSSHTGSVVLNVALTEDPPCSGQYNGIILGSDISTVFSSSLSESFFNTFTVVTSSFLIEILVTSASTTTSLHTTQVTQSHQVTASNTASFEIPLVETPDRCAGIYEIISSQSFFKVSSPMNLRSVRFIP